MKEKTYFLDSLTKVRKCASIGIVCLWIALSYEISFLLIFLSRKFLFLWSRRGAYHACWIYISLLTFIPLYSVVYLIFTYIDRIRSFICSGKACVDGFLPVGCTITLIRGLKPCICNLKSKCYAILRNRFYKLKISVPVTDLSDCKVCRSWWENVHSKFVG